MANIHDYILSNDTGANFRADLNIPLDATVFSRMGGFYSWNIPFVNSVIATVLNEREDVYFVFVG